MSKLKLVAEPTFKGSVFIPVPGSEPVPAEFTFKHRTKKAFDEFRGGREGKSDSETVLDMVLGWDLPDEFNAENVATFCDNYPGAGLAIFIAYIHQLHEGKVKN